MKKLILIIIIPLLMSACSKQIVANYSEDPDADFGRYMTYAWDIPLNKAVNESFNPLVNNDLVNKKIKSAIDERMESRGYIYSDENPDLLINFHTMVENRSEVTSAYPNSYYFWWRNDIRTINYKEGTLIIDLIDAETDELIWQGYATGVLDSEDLTLSADDGVRMIFEEFPYRAGSSAKQNTVASY